MIFNLQSNLPQHPSGLSDKDAALVLPLYRAINSLAQQMSVAAGEVTFSATDLANLDRLGGLTIGKYSRVAVVAGEDLSYGNLLSLSVSAGNIVAHKATAADLTKPALAALDLPDGLLLGQVGQATLMTGRVLGITGTAFGVSYYLGSAGAVTATAPTADGVLKQRVGIGLGSAGFYLDIVPVGRAIFDAYVPSAGVLRIQYTDGTQADHAV